MMQQLAAWPSRKRPLPKSSSSPSTAAAASHPGQSIVTQSSDVGEEASSTRRESSSVAAGGRGYKRSHSLTPTIAPEEHDDNDDGRGGLAIASHHGEL